MLWVDEAGQPDNTIFLMETTHSVVESADLIYSYEVIDGKMPAESGITKAWSVALMQNIGLLNGL